MWPLLFAGHGLVIYSYPLFMGLAWGIGYRLAEARLPKTLSHRTFTWWMLGLFVSSWLGAKVLFLATQEQWAPTELMQASSFWLGGGFVFLGGLLGAAIYGLLVSALVPQLHWRQMEFLSVPLLYSHAIGRIGCFLAGCCYGEVTQVPWAIHLHGADRHPVPLYEAFGLIVLAWMIQTKLRRELATIGYLVGYGLLRWNVELWRGDPGRGGWGGQSTSQLIALSLIVLGVALFIQRKLAETTKI